MPFLALAVVVLMIIIMAAVVGYLLYRRRTRLIPHAESTTPRAELKQRGAKIYPTPKELQHLKQNTDVHVEQDAADQDELNRMLSISNTEQQMEGKVRDITGEE